MRPLDFRSDTVTRPTAGMREAMAAAEVGDDVFGEDPSVIALEQRTAELLGKEAALFVPSGTMSNQIGVRLHCGAGDEFLCEVNCHIFNYEQGAYAQLSGVAAFPVEASDGLPRVEQLVSRIRPDDPHLVRTRLLCLENTHNRWGGRVLPYDGVAELCGWARDNGLATHLDGARLFNAVAATGVAAADWAAPFDTVSVCFSKGLGAPVGSAIVGPRELIERRAVRVRKLFGGGMRQAGVIAAGALYALEHHRQRLVDDHRAATAIAEAVRQCEGLSVLGGRAETNIVIFQIDAPPGTNRTMVDALAERGVLAITVGHTSVRLVTHLDVSLDDAVRAGETIKHVWTTIGASATA
ncbi:MAG: low specificity L-threonine aldolase [Planctomycetales bacterium]|nr:low specificity L-threonine aldolase [Planctomycetales bacterium]